jgi:hypothetical protein
MAEMTKGCLPGDEGQDVPKETEPSWITCECGYKVLTSGTLRFFQCHNCGEYIVPTRRLQEPGEYVDNTPKTPGLNITKVSQVVYSLSAELAKKILINHLSPTLPLNSTVDLEFGVEDELFWPDDVIVTVREPKEV